MTEKLISFFVGTAVCKIKNLSGIKFRIFNVCDINRPKEGEPITKYLLDVYVMEPRYKSGYVNRMNDFCSYAVKKVRSELREKVWNRNADSESEILEIFLRILNDGVKEAACSI